LEFVSRPSTDVEDIAAEFQADNPGLVAAFEDDSSLDYNGAEVVSHYGPLDETSKAMKMVCDFLSVSKCKSHNTNCCGLHVSFSKEGLKAYDIARYVVFWNAPQNKMFLISYCRRWDDDEHGNGYAVHKPHKGRLPSQISRDQMGYGHEFLYNDDRYEMVNLQNEKRIEVRAFRGTTIASTAMACMSLSVWLMAYCQTDGGLHFEDFILWCKTAKVSRGDQVFTPKNVIDYWESRRPAPNARARRGRDGRFVRQRSLVRETVCAQ
jgi:hypothetical protein